MKINNLIVRFIPACAGNRHSRRSFCAHRPVHPRVCGEQSGHSLANSIGLGSSPRVRGTGPLFPRKTRFWRFIPACAGNSSVHSTMAGSVPVHPRVCGEQSGHSLANSIGLGSSPRVRGTDARLMGWMVHHRFIPACAGNRSPVQRFLITNFGSSPRVRGTGPRPQSLSGRPGFIPACAGNRRMSVMNGSRTPVHPRVCGEQLKTVGSSPRVRGTAHEVDASWHDERFIPACAGNSPSTWSSARNKTVHPRVCGEQLIGVASN